MVGAAPAAEVVEAAADEDAAVALAVELAVLTEAEEDVVEPVVALEGSRVPHLSEMLVVQFFWAVESPTFAALHSLKASWQTN